MNRIISDLLAITRLEAGQLVVERAPIGAPKIIAEVAETQKALVESRGLEFRLELTDGLPEVLVDRDRISQVLENLIGNAIKFTSSGTISIGAAPMGNEVMFWVADTGTGISEADLPHVFDRFWQARRADRTGAGLGLPIVKGFVEAHGGHVWATSQIGRGAKFFFTLPIAQSAGEPAPRPWVLLAEDDSDVRESLAGILSSAGYQVIGVENGAEALEQLRRVPPPSLLILDLRMPVMDGLSVLAVRERDPALLSIPVIVVSADANIKGSGLVATARHLQKPISADELLATVTTVIGANRPDHAAAPQPADPTDGLTF
jgi:CheY-like chemotaxis protein